MRFCSFVCVLGLLAAGSACKDDGEDMSITFFDAAPPDATPAPDAFVCPTTECGTLCVDTATDPLNCGGCGMACDSPGQTCSGSLPCECPANFVPATIGGSVMMQQGVYAGIHFNLGSSSLFTVGYDPETTTVDEDIALPVTGGAFATPLVAALFNVDIASQTAQTIYATTSGTIRFDLACPTGVAGTITDLVLTEADVATQMPLEGGCTLEVAAATFAFGDNCPEEGGETPNRAPVSSPGAAPVPAGAAALAGELWKR